MKETPKSLLD